MIPQEAISLILEAEGLDQPSRWPGAESGITLGFGYDLGYVTAAEFGKDWGPHFSPEQIARLKLAIGDTGGDAERIAAEFKDIKVSRAAALDVFTRATLPKYEALTRRAFPGVELLPALAFGALVSLVFNRGAGMQGDSRREMRSIRDVISRWAALNTIARALGLQPLVRSVAAQIRSMKRIWRNRGLGGLIIRRENEARLVECSTESPVAV